MKRSLSIVGTPRVYVLRKKSQKTKGHSLYYLQFLNPETGRRESRALGSAKDYALHVKREFERAIHTFFVTGQLVLPERGITPTSQRLSFE